MRLFIAATLVATVFVGSNAFAQGDYTHHKWCMQKGSSNECAYDTLAQCKASKSSPDNRCMRNTAPMNH
jgi:hypothetical protein